MREIKFRGKRIDNKNWVYGYYNWCCLGNEHMIAVNNDYDEDRIYYNFNKEANFYKVIPETAGQYTGLKDKNDKEIYEGDILKFTWDEDSCWGEPGTYKGYIQFSAGVFEIVYIGIDKIRKYPDGGWSENSASGDIKSFLWWTEKENIKVIGNIYENPELLKK